MTAPEAVVSRRAGPSVPGTVVHSFRPTLFTGERRFSLDATSLIWSDGRSEHRLPLADVVRVHIYHAPGGSGRTIRRTILTFKSGPKVVVQSNHLVRLGVIEDRAESYRAFVESLLERLKAANPTTQVMVGPPIALWLTYLLILVGCSVVMVGGLLLWLAGEFPLSAAVTFGLLAGFVPLAWRVVTKGRARRVDFGSLPEDLPD